MSPCAPPSTWHKQIRPGKSTATHARPKAPQHLLSHQQQHRGVSWHLWSQNLSTLFHLASKVYWVYILSQDTAFMIRSTGRTWKEPCNERCLSQITLKGALRQAAAWEAPKAPREASRWAGMSSSAISERDTGISIFWSTYKCTEPQQPLISTAGRGWQKTIMPPGRISQGTLPGCDHQPLAAAKVWQCTHCTLQTKKSSHLSLPKLGLTHQIPISPLTLLPTCSTFWMNSLVSLTLPKLQTVLRRPLAGGRDPVHYPGLLPHITLQNGTCRPFNIPGVASSKSLAEDPQTWGLQLTPHCIVNWPQLQEDPRLPQWCARGSQNVKYGGF